MLVAAKQDMRPVFAVVSPDEIEIEIEIGLLYCMPRPPDACPEACRLSTVVANSNGNALGLQKRPPLSAELLRSCITRNA
jgi:hypothetical protein